MRTWHALGNSHCIRIRRQVKIAAKLYLVFQSAVIKKLFGIVFSSSDEISGYYHRSRLVSSTSLSVHHSSFSLFGICKV